MRPTQIIVAMFLGMFVCGCASQRSVVAFDSFGPNATDIAFGPTGSFQPKSGRELLAEFNAHLPFEVNPRGFMCKPVAGGRLTGWAVVQTADQVKIVKSSLKASRTLRILQVEALTEDVEEVLRDNWEKSQSVTPSGH